MSTLLEQETIEPRAIDGPHYRAGHALMTQQPRVAVIVLSCDDYAQRYLTECYASLRTQTYPTSCVTLFIVTNGVTDDSRQLTSYTAPRARLLHNLHNLGWSGGNNTAIRVALDEGFEYLVMLNMDTVVDADWLLRLVEAAEAQPDTHIIQSKILLHGTRRINSCGNRIQYLGYGYCDGYGQEEATWRPETALDAASGAAMLVKREVFERIGLFREDYFMYYDDVEFCWRARVAGFNVGLAGRSICYHKYDREKSLKWLYHLQRNRWMTLLTLERLPTLMLTAPCLLVAESLFSCYLLAKGWGAAQRRVIKEFLQPQTWRSILVGRREIRRVRIRRDAEIVKQFAGRLTCATLTHPIVRYVINPLLATYWAIAKLFIVW